jgi:hypothetical protein
MSIVMDDGYALPGDVEVDNAGSVVSGQWFDYSLRIGKIVAVFLPDEKGNFNQKFIEYSVETHSTDGLSGPAPITYPRCLLMNRFGGVADYERWTPRIDKDDEDGFNIGSQVLLLCVNGKSRSGIIVGGVPNVRAKTREEKFKDNHRYEWEFNGIKERVNNDGEYLWTRRGPTKADGTVRDEDGAGFSFLTKNDGNAFLGYNLKIDSTEAQDACSIQFNKKDKKLTLFAESDIFSETKAKFSVKTTDGVKINDGGANAQAFMMGTAYRRNEEMMNQKMQIALQILSTTLQSASTLLQAVSTAHKVPIYGPIVGSVPLQAAALLVNSASQAVSQLKSAIQSFEQSKSDYLSNKHTFAESA